MPTPTPSKRSPVMDRNEAERRIHWKVPTIMLGCFVLSVVTAVGHHFFCEYLDGRPVFDQAWNTRAGIAFANVMKIFLVASVGVSFTQRIWRTAMMRYLSLNSVDNLFSATSNPLSFFDGALLKQAKIAMLLALTIWISPLITIIAPGSIGLTVETTVQDVLMNIKTLNLSRAIGDLNQAEQSRAVQLTELTHTALDLTGPGEGAQEYYRPSSRATALIYQTVYGRNVITAASPCGTNCTYFLSFTAPAYKCTPVNTENSSPLYGSPSDVSRASWYRAWNTSADFCKTMGDSASCNVKVGDEYVAGKIQVEYLYLPQTERDKWEADNTHAIPSNAWQFTAFLCEQWFTRFDVRTIYVNAVQKLETNKTYIEPVQYGVAAIDQAYNQTYWIAYSMHRVLYSILQGQIGTSGRDSPQDSTDLDGSELVDDVAFPIKDGIRKPRQNLSTLFEELSSNVSLSLLSVDGLVHLQPQPDTSVSTDLSSTVFRYNRKALWITYGVGIAIGVISLAIGLLALFEYGASMKGGFLTVMRTTRNPTLDGISAGQTLGSEPVSQELGEARIKFGELSRSYDQEGKGERVAGAGPSYVGFGVEGTDDVGVIRKRNYW